MVGEHQQVAAGVHKRLAERHAEVVAGHAGYLLRGGSIRLRSLRGERPQGLRSAQGGLGRTGQQHAKNIAAGERARVRFWPRQLRNHRPGGEVEFGGGIEVGMARKIERRSSRRPVDGPVEVGASGRS